MVPTYGRLAYSLKWTDGMPSSKGPPILWYAEWTDGSSEMTDSFPYFRDEDFYAFSSGKEEGGSCPTLQLNTEEDHPKIIKVDSSCLSYNAYVQ